MDLYWKSTRSLFLCWCAITELMWWSNCSLENQASFSVIQNAMRFGSRFVQTTASCSRKKRKQQWAATRVERKIHKIISQACNSTISLSWLLKQQKLPAEQPRLDEMPWPIIPEGLGQRAQPVSRMRRNTLRVSVKDVFFESCGCLMCRLQINSSSISLLMTKKAQKTNSGTVLSDSHWDGAVLKSSKSLCVGVNYVLLSHLTMSVYFMMHHCAKHYMENMIKYHWILS